MTSASPEPRQVKAPVTVKPPAPPPSSALPMPLGAYTLEEVIGQGGMGTVYKARRQGLDRVMAVKLINAGAFASDVERHRFRVEAENAAKLQHPNIVQVLEVGDVGGQAYFVMEYVEGPMLSSMVQDKPLQWRQACRYVKTLAEAVQFAHQKGILHRDLKPQNVLIDRFDAPKIADFGLSRQIGYEGGLTVTGQMIGTPNYMPLEQALGEHSKVGPWSDVYSLGAILYELVTTIPPFLGTTIADIVDRLQRQQPISPIGVNPQIPPDLNTVILKCLEKDADQRYESAAELAVELGRVLRDVPIEARPISAPNRLLRWAKRNKALAALSTFAVVMVVAIALVSTYSYWQTSMALAREAKLRQDAEKAILAAEAAKSDLSVALSRSDFLRGLEFINQEIPKPSEGLAYLASALRHDPRNQAAQTRLVSMLASRAWMIPAGPPLKHAGNVIKVVYSPDGKTVLTGSRDGTAILWNARTSDKIRTFGKHEKELTDICFSRDGKLIATASRDGTARIWVTATGKQATLPLQHNNPVNSVAFDPDGKWLLTAADGGIVALWDTTTGDPVPRLGSRTRPLSAGVAFAKFSPNGNLIVAASGSNAMIWEVGSGDGHPTGEDADAPRRRGTQSLSITCPGEVSAAAFSPDSEQLVVAFGGSNASSKRWYAEIYNPHTGSLIGSRMEEHTARIVDASFSPDGNYIATASLDRTARVWDAKTGTRVGQRLEHQLGVTSAVFSPDSKHLLTASVSGNVMLWNVGSSRAEVSPLQQSEQILSITFSPDGKSIATALADSTARIYHIGRASAAPVHMQQDGVLKARFNAAGDRVISWGVGSEVFLWDALTGKLISKLPHPDQGRIGAEWSADGKTILTYQAFRAARLWDGATGQPKGGWLAEDPRLRMATLSPDGSWILTALDRNEVGLFSTADGKQAGDYIDVPGAISYLAFSKDSKRFGVAMAAPGEASDDPVSMKVWTVAPLATTDIALGEVHEVPQHEGRLSPTGDLQLIARSETPGRGDNSAVTLWDFKKSREQNREMRHGDPVTAARFSPDGKYVVTGSSDSTARVWDTATGKPVTPPLQHAGVVNAVAMSPDSGSIATIAGNLPSSYFPTRADCKIVVWDKETDMPVIDALTHPGPNRDRDARPRDVTFSPDGRRLLVAWNNGSICIWTIKLEPGATPTWLPDIAESLAGMRINTLGVLETIPDPAALLRSASEQLPDTPAKNQRVAREKDPLRRVVMTGAPLGPLNALAAAITQTGND
ncbi:hypothetical protein DB346_01255 [Verrucomicrobia bacterium LW23]|nr:hypothetical protein DB346_01255 [Verrucomicrobia bacterium LW23]